MTWTCRNHEHGREYSPAPPCTICHEEATRMMTCACCGAHGQVPPCDHRTSPGDVDAPMPGSPLAGGPVLCWRCACDCPVPTPMQQPSVPTSTTGFEQEVLW